MYTHILICVPGKTLSSFQITYFCTFFSSFFAKGNYKLSFPCCKEILKPVSHNQAGVLKFPSNSPWILEPVCPAHPTSSPSKGKIIGAPNALPAL